MAEPAQPLRIHVTWGPDTTENARLRSVLATLGMAPVSTDEVATLYAKERKRKEPPAPAGRRVSVRG